MYLKETELAEVCNLLPSTQLYDPSQDSVMAPEQMFICACGFEDRCMAIPSLLSKSGRYKTRYSFLFEHQTNPEENARNRPLLENYLSNITEIEVQNFTYKDEDFVARFEGMLDRVLVSNEELLSRITFDISGCSTQMILSALKLLLQRKIRLRLLYVEAAIYHPTPNEYKQSPQDWTIDGAGMSKGILEVVESRLYLGNNLSQLPTLLVAFATFKPERIRYIQAELQPAKTIWIIGIPHAPENQWRIEAMRKINEMPEDETSYKIHTFDHIETFSKLEQIYRDNEESHHMIIAPHGSKLQSVGIALFTLLRQDVGLWFSTPKSFNPVQYTGGVKEFWQIDFGDVQEVVKTIQSCSKLKLEA